MSSLSGSIRYSAKSKGYLHLYLYNGVHSSTSYSLHLESGMVTGSQTVYRTRYVDSPTSMLDGDAGLYLSRYSTVDSRKMLLYPNSVSNRDFFSMWFAANPPRTTKADLVFGNAENRDEDDFSREDFEKYKADHPERFQPKLGRHHEFTSKGVASAA